MSKLFFGPMGHGTSAPTLDRNVDAVGYAANDAKVLAGRSGQTGLIPRTPIQAKQSTGFVMPGRVIFVTECPFGNWQMPKATTSPGGIELPDVGDPELTQALFYGLVVRTGIYTYSRNTDTVAEEGEREKLLEIARRFPLPMGSLIVHTCARPFFEKGDRTLSVCCDHLHRVYLPDEKWPAHIEAKREKS